MQYKANKLKDTRIHNKLTQQEVAEAIHMSQTGYSPIELGTRKVDLDILLKLANLYNENPNDLMEPSDITIIFNDKIKNMEGVIIDYKNTVPDKIIDTLKDIIAYKDALIDQKIKHILKLETLINNAVKKG